MLAFTFISSNLDGANVRLLRMEARLTTTSEATTGTHTRHSPLGLLRDVGVAVLDNLFHHTNVVLRCNTLSQRHSLFVYYLSCFAGCCQESLRKHVQISLATSL